MSEVSIDSYQSYILPRSVATKRTLSYVVSELERIDNELTALSHHEGDQPYPEIPDAVQDFLKENGFSLDNTNDRSQIIEQLRKLKHKAPVVNMTFAVEADSVSLGELAGWLRDNVHKQSLITPGFQPALVAGVYMRTPNHIYDMSLRGAFKQGREKLLNELEALGGNE